MFGGAYPFQIFRPYERPLKISQAFWSLSTAKTRTSAFCSLKHIRSRLVRAIPDRPTSRLAPLVLEALEPRLALWVENLAPVIGALASSESEYSAGQTWQTGVSPSVVKRVTHQTTPSTTYDSKTGPSTMPASAWLSPTKIDRRDRTYRPGPHSQNAAQPQLPESVRRSAASGLPG
jgi:hypothetical protein